MSGPLTYGSVCSGIEAATQAWHPLGWRAAFFSEIEPFPRAVLAHRWPGTPIHGDFTTIQRGDYDPIDLLVGGTPCQSFSVAGLRKGLADERGNLTLEFVRLAQRLKPRWLVWENVPGVLSQDGGRAFGSFLGALAELGYGFAYRVLDAQHFGLAQRRQRVFLVGHLGDWRPPAAVLFEPESLRRDTTPRRGEGKAVAALTANGVGTCGADDNQGQAGHLIAHTLRGEGFDASEDGTGRGTPLVAVEPYTLAIRGREGDHRLEYRQDGTANAVLTPNGGRGGIGVGAVAFGWNKSASQTLRVDTTTDALQASPSSNPAVAIPLQEVGKRTGMSTDDPRAGIGIGGEGEPMFTLQAGAQHGVAFAQNTRDEVRYVGGGVAGALAANAGMKQQSYVQQAMAVRRLTPTECERLQGFPDGYTDVPFRGKKAADGNRYRALGNSMAVPCMAHIGRRIGEVEAMLSA